MKMNRPHMQIKKNKERATRKEMLAAEWLKSQGYVVLEHNGSYHSYDFIVEKDGQKLLIEHKSCLEKIYSAQKNYPNNVRFGRFKIILENHNEMPIKAKELDAKPFYLFQLVYTNSSVYCMKSWEEIDKVLKRTSRYYFIPLKVMQ